MDNNWTLWPPTAEVANVAVTSAALLVAVVSVIFAYIGLRNQRIHNRLSVKPIPFISLANYEDCLRLKIVNNGSGPLIIRSLMVTLDDHVGGSVIEFMPLPPKIIAWSTYTSLFSGRALLPKDEIKMLELKIDDSVTLLTNFRDEVRGILARMTFELQYEDIYGNKFEPYRRDGSWFRGLTTDTSNQRFA